MIEGNAGDRRIPLAPAAMLASPRTRTSPDIMFSATPGPALPLTITLASAFIPAA